jgi:hypothetical protein
MTRWQAYELRERMFDRKLMWTISRPTDCSAALTKIILPKKHRSCKSKVQKSRKYNKIDVNSICNSHKLCCCTLGWVWLSFSVWKRNVYIG